MSHDENDPVAEQYDAWPYPKPSIGLEPPFALEVVRALSAYFGAVNMAEQVHRMRRSIDYLREDVPQPNGLRAAALELVRRGTSAEEVAAALERILVEPVCVGAQTRWTSTSVTTRSTWGTP